MVDDDDLANECLCDRRRVVSVAHNFPSTNLILGNTAYVEPYVVSGFRFGHSNMVSLDRLALADFARWHRSEERRVGKECTVRCWREMSRDNERVSIAC